MMVHRVQVTVIMRVLRKAEARVEGRAIGAAFGLWRKVAGGGDGSEELPAQMVEPTLALSMANTAFPTTLSWRGGVRRRLGKTSCAKIWRRCKAR